ncbi:MAG: tRNA (adenosine(37)-N6)-threonylcarbamoyltransferase complex dimerization subunit type 1 TsaB [Endomicrobium sp.]|jgi:tRNA threonylcarbamoyl adenosine modification protein YeaZ|nr:tRNA (adenosine(37)-N6)-threonylcarbamoyltransferase complex dimerization subunit type 1 TsaB [Endomicrobium sp.]
MKILALENSGPYLSVALNDNNQNIASYCQYGYNQYKQHIISDVLITLIDKILYYTDNNLNAIDKFAISIGPGSFTGLRIGMSIIKTFAQIFNKPIVGVDTLSILENYLPFAIDGIKIVAARNALRKEVYIKDNINNNVIIIQDINNFVKNLKKHSGKILIIGDVALDYKDLLNKELGQYSTSLPQFMHIPQAKILAQIAYKVKGVDYKSVKLLYVRRPYAK